MFFYCWETCIFVAFWKLLSFEFINKKHGKNNPQNLYKLSGLLGLIKLSFEFFRRKQILFLKNVREKLCGNFQKREKCFFRRHFQRFSSSFFGCIFRAVFCSWTKFNSNCSLLFLGKKIKLTKLFTNNTFLNCSRRNKKEILCCVFGEKSLKKPE